MGDNIRAKSEMEQYNEMLESMTATEVFIELKKAEGVCQELMVRQAVASQKMTMAQMIHYNKKNEVEV